ncbi:MAG: zinc ribbon domain-containing protein [Gammaproteobacteria bacterium]|nr:zinc ribbon domain-containing protein [Gammaproteobacteria bacterium]NNC97550.1 zinc ribbon domain-containing protein [Gammaproteobacteria bacterium]
MPIYEYQCGSCNQISDALQKMSDAPLVTCPECNEDALKKLVSAPRFRLAGSGWYETDFKNDNKRNLASSDDKESKVKNAANKADQSKAGSSETNSASGESKSTTKNKSTGTSNKGDGKAA